MTCKFCGSPRQECLNELLSSCCVNMEFIHKDCKNKPLCGWSPKDSLCLYTYCERSKKVTAFSTCQDCNQMTYNNKTGQCESCPKEEPVALKASLSPGYSHARWETLLAKSFQEIRHLGQLKGGEYSGDSDRLENFRRNAKDLDLPMEVIWRVYSAKHWDALGQYIRDQQKGKERKRLEKISGRVDDLLVYLLLFKAMLDEKGEL